MKNNRILITGIPGSGKTTIGNYMRDNHDYVHIDLENELTLGVLFSNPGGYIKGLINNTREDIVVTWGFVPDSNQIDIVKLFKKSGFKLIWFDGNRDAARRAFIKRNTVSVDLLEKQMKKINNSDVVKKIKPTIINPFKDKGNFKQPNQIVKEITRRKVKSKN